MKSNYYRARFVGERRLHTSGIIRHISGAKNAKVKTDGAVKLFDWSCARKLEEE